MNALEANAITRKAESKIEKLDHDKIDAWLEIIYKKIRVAAERGESKIENPFDGMRMLPPTPIMKKEILRILRDAQYRVTVNNDEMSAPSILIEW